MQRNPGSWQVGCTAIICEAHVRMERNLASYNRLAHSRSDYLSVAAPHLWQCCAGLSQPCMHGTLSSVARDRARDIRWPMPGDAALSWDEVVAALRLEARLGDSTMPNPISRYRGVDKTLTNGEHVRRAACS